MWPKPESVLFSTKNKYMLKLMDRNIHNFMLKMFAYLVSTQYLDSSSVAYPEGDWGGGCLLNPPTCPPFLNIL